jgi:acyl-CoA reductase-like NAD-dependent aldehyde dehydrogenase
MVPRDDTTERTLDAADSSPDVTLDRDAHVTIPGARVDATIPGAAAFDPTVLAPGSAPDEPTLGARAAWTPTMAPPANMAPASVRLPDGALVVAGTRYEDGDTAWVVDPWSRTNIAAVVLADSAKAEMAARAAALAFETTRRVPSYARRRLLREISRRVAAAREELATLIMRESGKPKTLARFEVDRAIVTFGLGAEEAVRIGGEVTPLDVTEQSAHYRGQWQRVPRGPVLAITPFNYPLNLVAHKVAPALACGATVVLKPAPQTPLTALRLGEIVREAGGGDTLQVVPCTNDVAETLVRSDVFSVLSFTGSDKVGWHLKSIAGKKHVLLELGGNAACIVHDDAANGPAKSLAQIAALVCSSAFNYAGQVCIKTQRLYVQRSVADKLLAELVPRACSYAPQDPQLPTSAIGPMIDEKSAARLEEWINEAQRAGATLLACGKREGNRMPATVIRIEGEGAGLRIVEEEAFGPVLTVHVYDTWDEALRMANASRYGLQAGIFTDSLTRVREAYDRLDVGALIVNDVPSTRIDAMPYGGKRDSGMGREGVRYAIEEMTDRKMLVTRGST